MREGQDKIAYLITDYVYEEVPQKIRTEVKLRIEALTA